VSRGGPAPAARAAAYYHALTRGDIEVVLAMFAPDAEMRDPVGAPAASTDMERRQRYAAIDAAFASFTISAEEIIGGGADEAAARWRVVARTHGGREVRFTGVSIFVFDADGRIARMSAYWDAATVAAAMAG